MLAEKVEVRFPAYASPNVLISSDNQDKLLSLRDVLTTAYFEIGRIANEEILANAHRKGITAQSVYDAVGVFVGRSGRTVRYYAETAAFFSPDTCAEYDMLSFSHFDIARNYPDYWHIVLELARTNPGMSAEQLKLISDKFIKNNFDVRPPAYEKGSGGNFDWNLKSDVHLPACGDSSFCADGDTDFDALTAQIKKELPRVGIFSAAQLVGKILNALAALARLLGDYDISDELKREVVIHVEALNDLIPRVVSDIDAKNGKK